MKMPAPLTFPGSSSCAVYIHCITLVNLCFLGTWDLVTSPLALRLKSQILRLQSLQCPNANSGLEESKLLRKH